VDLSGTCFAAAAVAAVATCTVCFRGNDKGESEKVLRRNSFECKSDLRRSDLDLANNGTSRARVGSRMLSKLEARCRTDEEVVSSDGRCSFSFSKRKR
jgi:hypothetical protein